MFDHCSYHLLDSLMPPSAYDELSIQNSLLRLENLSACAIVKGKKSCQSLSKTPPHLHKTIWKAYLRDEYYAHEDNTHNLDVVIPELLYHWPYEEFTLKEIIPKFPPRLNRFASFWHTGTFGPSYQNTIILDQFYEDVSNIIAHNIPINSNDSIVKTHNHNCKLRKINISGFCIFKCNAILVILAGIMVGKNNEDGILDLLAGITVGKNNEVFLKDSVEKLEVTLDASLPLFTKHFDDLMVMAASKSISVKFNHETLLLPGSYQTNDVINVICEILVNNGLSSISLEGLCGFSVNEGSDIMEKVFQTRPNTCQKNILAVALDSYVSSMNFVKYLKNLVHLDLSDNDLHDNLDSLTHMHRGLLFLNLHNCNLNHMDLDQLTGSCHQSTLLELNLSFNSLSDNEDRNNRLNLMKLCQNLTNILQLDLGACDLELWDSEELLLLFDSIKIMPNIVNLNLYGNKFSIGIVTVDIMVLKESPSLKYLELSLPTQITDDYEYREDLIKLFCTRINTKMNNSRSQLLYVDLAE